METIWTYDIQKWNTFDVRNASRYNRNENIREDLKTVTCKQKIISSRRLKRKKFARIVINIAQRAHFPRRWNEPRAFVN